LFFVGAVLFLNGVMILGRIDQKAAAIFNLFVGLLQVVTPTFLIFTSGGDPNVILSASGLYLFGFTYLYVGITLLANFDTNGVGWFSLFVAVSALAYSFANFHLLNDNPFGVIWLYWAFLWFLFFLTLGLKMDSLTRYTGWITAIEGVVTAWIPGFLILSGYWVPENSTQTAIALGAFGVLMAVGMWLYTHRGQLGARRARTGERVAGTPATGH